MNKLKIIQYNLKQLYEQLKKNANADKTILPFLAQFFFFLYLGENGYIDQYKNLIQNLKEIKTSQEFESFLENLPVEINKSIKLNKSAIVFIQNSELLNLDIKNLTALEFCNIFESLINIQEKHSNGMYFTSEENILKAIKPLFLNELENELEILIKIKDKQNLEVFLEKLSSLTFLDPACGVGNFLIVTFKYLKRLEEKLRETTGDDFKSTLKVNINQFYGIELSPEITTIARIALKIAEIEYNHSNSEEINQIITANALRFDWNNLIPNDRLNFIIGNPPFLGARVMDKDQKNDLLEVFGSKWKNRGDLDYVSGWFKKAFDYMKETPIQASLVATSSISEGLSAGALFAPLIKDGFKINFAYRSFEWDQSSNKAIVYVVIIGFSATFKDTKAILYSDRGEKEVEHINGYLIDSPEIYITRRFKPLCLVPEMGIGCKPIDGGYYLFKKDEYEAFIEQEPKSKKFFVPFYGSEELVNQEPRYCLYLGESEEEEYENLELVKERVEKVRDFRLKSKSELTRKLAQKPTSFHVTNYPRSAYLAIPRVSSPNRVYIPIGFMTEGDMASDSLLIIPDTSLYHFGVLISKLHMVWLNFVCGRLGNAIRYSKHLVYNNFPWPDPTEEEKARISNTAQKILVKRGEYKVNLSILYNPQTMPKDLKEAHLENDKAVIEAYHLNNTDEDNLIKVLFDRYLKLIKEKG